MEKRKGFFSKLTVTQIIILSFLSVIAVGTLLLSFPFSAASGQWTDFTTALFTAVSATCVTGLTVVETATYFSVFGKIVILLLIQVGGLGIMTIVSMFSVMFARSSSLKNRNIAMQSTGAITYGEIKGLLAMILAGTAIFEIAGAAILAIRFTNLFGVGEGIKQSIFLSVSAFCNAGFDIIGSESLASFAADPLVLLVVAWLVVTGGIGYIVWLDVIRNGIHVRKYTLHSKIALTMTGSLLLIGTGAFLLTEYNGAYGAFSFPQKLLNAFFQSVTLRTAGFFAVDQASISDSGVLVCYIFMFIGGTSGSTAGGLKTTTFAVLLLSFIASLKRDQNVVVFKRKISSQITKVAFSIAFAYLSLLFVAIIAILMIESGGDGMNLQNITFEAISAIATVGLSRGITPHLQIASKIILSALMYMGRIGGLTFMLAFSTPKPILTTTRPKENILIG